MIHKALDGHGSDEDPDIVCGQCGAVLMHHQHTRIRLLNLKVCCFVCLSVNELSPAPAN
jgi:hypothetical protein